MYVAGELSPWPSKQILARILQDAGLEIVVGKYSIRVEDCSYFVFQHYGGDLCDPTIESDADTIEDLIKDCRLVSHALCRVGVRHRLEIYDEKHTLECYVHFDWPQDGR